jgi:hypothetical protein
MSLTAKVRYQRQRYPSKIKWKYDSHSRSNWCSPFTSNFQVFLSLCIFSVAYSENIRCYFCQPKTEGNCIDPLTQPYDEANCNETRPGYYPSCWSVYLQADPENTVSSGFYRGCYLAQQIHRPVCDYLESDFGQYGNATWCSVCRTDECNSDIP